MLRDPNCTDNVVVKPYEFTPCDIYVEFIIFNKDGNVIENFLRTIYSEKVYFPFYFNERRTYMFNLDIVLDPSNVNQCEVSLVYKVFFDIEELEYFPFEFMSECFELLENPDLDYQREIGISISELIFAEEKKNGKKYNPVVMKVLNALFDESKFSPGQYLIDHIIKCRMLKMVVFSDICNHEIADLICAKKMIARFFKLPVYVLLEYRNRQTTCKSLREYLQRIPESYLSDVDKPEMRVIIFAFCKQIEARIRELFCLKNRMIDKTQAAVGMFCKVEEVIADPPNAFLLFGIKWEKRQEIYDLWMFILNGLSLDRKDFTRIQRHRLRNNE